MTEVSDSWQTNLGDWSSIGGRDSSLSRNSPDRSATNQQQQLQQQNQNQNQQTPGILQSAAAPLLPPASSAAAAAASSTSQQTPAPSFLQNSLSYLGFGSGTSKQQETETEQKEKRRSASMPFFNPTAEANSSLLQQQQQLQQNDEDYLTRNEPSVLHAQHFLPDPDFSRSSVDRTFYSSSSDYNNNTSTSSDHQLCWVAFAPLLPEEVQSAVVSIVGSFSQQDSANSSSHNTIISRYATERVLSSRFSLPINSTGNMPTVLSLVVYANNHQNALSLMHRHQRQPLFKSQFGSSSGGGCEVKCVLTGEPATSLWCGKLDIDPAITSSSASVSSFLPVIPKAHYVGGRPTSMAANENKESLELASHVRKGNHSVYEPLEVKQKMPLHLQIQYFWNTFYWNLIYLVVGLLLFWWWFM